MNALSIWSNINSLDLQNKVRAESYYAKSGPYMLTVEVNGQNEYVCGTTPYACVTRADTKFSDWEELQVQTQTDFMRANK